MRNRSVKTAISSKFYAFTWPTTRSQSARRRNAMNLRLSKRASVMGSKLSPWARQFGHGLAGHNVKSWSQPVATKAF
ncbi:hypothetical protein N7481_001559 [Penicillium waksmanii]|uniref:uncharacterized protein n=1 Tax=Penicillium waksmanii TaxID=69791 RepID=UPI002546AF1A|nr:uncharacterized protein N7481_001559 [Penicillium waksmanii]KAJ6001150.1 hypothetical protein N7481_001559 [Penicillium waksmanii]